MADEVQVIEQPQQTNGAPQSSELDQQMKMALGNYVDKWQDVPAADTPKPAATIPPVEQQTQTDSASIIQPTTPTDNPFEAIKTKFNYQSAEDAIKEIEELRALKNNIPQPQKYENEESEKLAKAWQAGKKDEVRTYLNKQAEIERLTSIDVNKDTASEIVKTGMALKYRDLTPEEIAYKFNKQYGLPSKPVQSDLDSDEDYQQKVSAWQEQVNDKTMELMIDAKLAKPEIESAKTKLELPSIDVPVDNEYLQWKKDMEIVEKLDAQAAADYQKFTPDAVKVALDFNDEANKIKFPYQYQPDEDSFKNAIELVSDYDKFWNLFKNSDGSPNRPKFLDFVYKGLYADKMIVEGIKQGSNARFKAQLPDNSNGAVRYLPQDQQLSELDRQMEQAGVKRAAV